MRFTIHKGKRRPSWWWLRWPFYFNVKVIEMEFLFDFSGVYEFSGEAKSDQEDRNKLFGISYYPDPHKESARIGWRYDPAKRMFIISVYCHVNGQTIIDDFCQVPANRKYIGRIEIKKDYYRFEIFQKDDAKKIGASSVPKWHDRTFGYKLGLYFGGNQVAPHDIKIEIKKV
jgi:hypothetical protein